MKVLQVIPSLNLSTGGPVEGLIQSGIEMVRAGHTVHTLSLDPGGIEIDRRILSETIFCVGPKYLKYGYAPRLERWLKEHVHMYDVVVVHGIWTYHSYCVAKVCRRVGVPYAVFVHGMLDPWFARAHPFKHLKKWLYWPWAEYRALRDARFVLFTTADELKLARQSFWLYAARESLVGYGIRRPDVGPNARDTFLSAFPHLAEKRILLYLSRLHPKKGCDLLIRSFAKIALSHPSAHLVLAGPADPGYGRELARIVSEFGLQDRVTFTGMLKGDMKWGAYLSADAFFLTSHQENFGIVVAEALALGLPVFTTFQVNIWREIEACAAGFVRSDDQVGSDDLLQQWGALTRADLDLIGSNARRCYAENFDVTHAAQRLMETLDIARSSGTSGHTFKGGLGAALKHHRLQANG